MNAPRPLGERFERALDVAFELHREQARKGTDVPYVAHLLGVASLVLEYGGGEDEAIAALLHDAVEDQGGVPTLERIRREFGPDVARIVDGLTDSYEEPKPPWRERKEAYVAELEHDGPDILRVSLADKLYNARAVVRDYRQLGDALWDRFRTKDRDSQLWYFGALRDVFDRRYPGDMADEFARTVAQLEALVAERTA